PLCRRVEDAALVMAAINGYDPTSAASIDMGFSYDGNIDVRRLKVGYSPDWFKEVGFGPGATIPASEAHLHALEAMRSLGVQIVEVKVPPLPYRALLHNLYVESAAVFQDLTLTHRDQGLLPDSSWRTTWPQAHMLSAVDYLQLERFRRLVVEEMHKLF